MTENKLGKRIKERRQSLRLTQSQLAERTGYKDKTAISRIESGENDLTQSKIMAFADALQTTPSYLMGWVEEPRPKTAKDNPYQIQEAYNIADEKTQRAIRIMLGLE